MVRDATPKSALKYATALYSSSGLIRAGYTTDQVSLFLKSVQQGTINTTCCEDRSYTDFKNMGLLSWFITEGYPADVSFPLRY